MALSHTRPSRPDSWSVPRPALDPSMRRQTYGPIRPMDEGRVFAFWRRMFGRP